MRTWLLLLWLCACGGARPAPVPDPIVALHGLPLTQILEEKDSLAGRSELSAVDRRALLDLAWRNRAPAEVGEDLTGVRPEDQAREAELRAAWRHDHVAWSWDNLNPDAQLEPRPAELSLAWLTLAWHLPLARNGRSFPDPRVADYFARKRWYRPVAGDLRLSMIDQVQRETIQKEIDTLTVEDLEAHLRSLPRPGMSPEEVVVERALAQALLQKRGPS